MKTLSIMVTLLIFFSLLISSSFVYSVMELFFMLIFADDLYVINFSCRSYSNVFISFCIVKIVSTININDIAQTVYEIDNRILSFESPRMIGYKYPKGCNPLYFLAISITKILFLSQNLTIT